MIASMAAFVINDTCVKLASATLPIGEIIAARSIAATIDLLILAAVVGGLALPRHPPLMLMGLRMVGEIAATLLFLSALVTLPLADMTAIAQFTPLALTAGAAIFLGESVGWRRWMATLVGLIGVGFIVRPGSTAFSVEGAMVFVSIGFIVMRDLATRRISAAVPTLTLTLTSAAAGLMAGLILLPFETWRVPTASETILLMLSGLFLAAGYGLIIIALRTGDVGVVSPFRYAIILFALASSALIWGETPDQWAMFGIVIVCSAGLYTFHRERLRTRAAQTTKNWVIMSTTSPFVHRKWYHPRSIWRSLLLRPRVFFGALAGVAALFLLPSSVKPAVRSALAWDLGGIVYLALALSLMVRFNAEKMKARSARADDGGAVILVLILIAILASFAAMTGLAGEARDAPKAEKLWYLGLAGATLFVSWLVTQVVFTIHYAHQHYARNPDGTDTPSLVFPNDDKPDYWDFFYFATSIGATSQTSDVSIRTKAMRRLVTLHAILSFFFNTMVLAITINIAAGLI